MAISNHSPDLERSSQDEAEIVLDEGEGYYEPVEWNFTRIVAVIALCIAYVGTLYQAWLLPHRSTRHGLSFPATTCVPTND